MDFTPQPISREEFASLYTRGETIVPEGVTTFLAQDRFKGRLVMVHELAPSPGEKRRIMNVLPRLADVHRALVLGVYLIDEEPVVVTKFLLGFVNFRLWVEHAMAESATVVLETRDDVSELERAAHDGSPAYLALKTAERQSVPLNLESVPSLEATSVGITPVPRTTEPAKAPAPPVPVVAAPILKVPTPPAAPPAMPSPPSPVVAPPAPVVSPPPPPPVAQTTAPAETESDSGMFTSLFGGGSAAPPPTPVPVAPVPPPVASTPVAMPPAPPPLTPPVPRVATPLIPVAPPSAPLGEDEPSLTEIFGGSSPAIPAAPTPPPAVTVVPPAPLPSTVVPTPILRVPTPVAPVPSVPLPPPTPVVPAPSVAPPAPNPATEGPSDFSQVFGHGLQAPPPRVAPPVRPPVPDVQRAAPLPPAPPPLTPQPMAPPSPAGGYAPPPAPPAAPRVPVGPPTLKPSFQAPNPAPITPGVAAQSQAPLAISGAGGGIKSDMTEMLKPARPLVRQNTPAPAVPDPAKSAAPARGASMKPLVIVLSLCVLVVLAAVLYAVLSR